MSKKPTRTWSLVASLGIPLAIVGVVAMAISYATLIDVARVNGIPLPELFPILIDVGTVATMIAAAQFRLRGVSGRWLAYSTFILLSGVSIVANASHAGRAADLTITTPWAAAILAATPPAVLLAITHLVMLLIPDEKERAKLQAAREKAELAQAKAVERERSSLSEPHPVRAPDVSVLTPQTRAGDGRPASPVTDDLPLRLVAGSQERSEDEVRERVLEYIQAEQKRPTGKLVGEWLGGKTPKTGQRFLKKMEDDGDFAPEESDRFEEAFAFPARTV